MKKCVACGECAYWCPKSAVRIANGTYARVDHALCVGCGVCAKHCPAEAIVITQQEVGADA